jgi:F-type H+-transporting ATPase subunit delta
MAHSRAASRYAKALLDLATEKNLVEQVHADMQQFVQVCEENRGLVNLLQSPIVPHYKKFAVLREVFQSRVHPVSFSIFEIITRKNREEILFDVAKEFHTLYNSHKGIQTAQITTVFPLDNALRSQFEAIVSKNTGKKVELEEKTDASLIGGFVLKIGNRQIDDSIRGKLQELKQQFSKN